MSIPCFQTDIENLINYAYLTNDRYFIDYVYHYTEYNHRLSL